VNTQTSTLKYFLALLLLTSTLLSAQKNKLITIYGTITLHVANSKTINNGKDVYIINVSHIDNKATYQRDIQLIFDPKIIDIKIPSGNLYANYKLVGYLQSRTYKKGANFYTPSAFKIKSAKITSSPIKISKISLSKYNPVNRNPHIKIKAKEKPNGITYVKMLISNPMVNERQALRQKLDIDYLKSIKATVDNKVVLNVKLNANVSKNPLFKFKYKSRNIRNSSIILTSIDNMNNKLSKKAKIKTNKKRSEVAKKKHLKRNYKSKKYRNKNKAIKELFGNITLIEDAIEIKTPRIAENGGAIPINIKSNIDAKSVTLFSLGSSEDLEFTCQFIDTPYSIIDYDLKIKMHHSFEIQVVIEAKDGKFYTAKEYIEVSIGGGN